MPILQVIVASSRPSRKAPAVAAWFTGQARAHGGFDVEVVDLADVDLPLLDEPEHPRLARYEHEHTRRWSEIVARGDAYVFVTPEYDWGTPAVLQNALQYLVREWAYKPAGFVSYGGVSAGTRAVAMTKQTLVSLRTYPVVEAVTIPFFTQHFIEDGSFDPGELQANAAQAMLGELLKVEAAMRALRAVPASRG